MKRVLSMIMAIVTCLSCCVLLASCGHECEWAADWSKDATHHWKACTDAECAEVNEKAEHTWDAGVEVAFGATQYTCSVCAQTKVDEKVTTVADDKWNEAFSFGENFVATMKQTHPTEGSMEMILSRENGKVAMTEKMTAPTGESETDNRYAYLDGSDCYMFANEDGVWMRELYPYMTSDEFIASFVDELLSEALRTRTNYTYNDATNLYTAASIVDGDDTASNVSIAFLDGKLVNFSFDATYYGTTVKVEFAITYGNASVTLPDVKGSVTAEQYASALDFTGKHFVVAHSTNSVGSTSYLQVGYYGDTVTVGVYEPQTYFYHDVDNSKYYSILTDWDSRQICSKDSFECYKAYMLHELLAFNNMTYDANLQVYRLASATICGEAATNIVVYFNDGVLTNITYETVSGGNTKVNSLYYTIVNDMPMIPGKNY